MLEHPAFVLLQEELDERGWSAADLAEHSGLPLSVCEQIASPGMVTPLTQEVAEGLSRAFGTSWEFWRNLDRRFYQQMREALDAEAQETAGRGPHGGQGTIMAYYVETGIQHCSVCSRAATGEVFNRLNATLGRYCKRHGEQRAREASKIEEAGLVEPQ